MSVLKYKNGAGEWIAVAAVDQVIEVEADKEWKEIEVTADTYTSGYGDMWEFDCAAAGINLLEDENWMLVCQRPKHSGFDSTYPVDSSPMEPVIITPIYARLQGEDMSQYSLNRIGIYIHNANSYGFTGYGAALYQNIGYSRPMTSGVSITGTQRTYNTSVCVPQTNYEQKAKLIYLGNKEG